MFDMHILALKIYPGYFWDDLFMVLCVWHLCFVLHLSLLGVVTLFRFCTYILGSMGTIRSCLQVQHSFE